MSSEGNLYNQLIDRDYRSLQINNMREHRRMLTNCSDVMWPKYLVIDEVLWRKILDSHRNDDSRLNDNKIGLNS